MPGKHRLLDHQKREDVKFYEEILALRAVCEKVLFLKMIGSIKAKNERNIPEEAPKWQKLYTKLHKFIKFSCFGMFPSNKAKKLMKM